MLNQLCLVGRLVSDPSNDTVTLAVPRSYKNAEGSYDTDFIPVKLLGGIAQSTVEYCRKGDLIGVKGRIECKSEDDGDGHYTRKMTVVAERVTFLSANKGGE